tara:strand:+ start:561 stop:926 length:366 start_codon:yes stop_codon:yes gene_type:complete
MHNSTLVQLTGVFKQELLTFHSGVSRLKVVGLIDSSEKPTLALPKRAKITSQILKDRFFILRYLQGLPSLWRLLVIINLTKPKKPSLAEAKYNNGYTPSGPCGGYPEPLYVRTVIVLARRN